jgi:F-type H+-transporting ATPase subunit c
MPTLGIIAIAAAIAALCGAFAAMAMGNATGRATEAIARQPEAAGKINSSLLFGLILMETCAVYALLVAILIVFILGGKVAA